MFSLAIQSFGREEEYKRAILAILSFFSWYPNDPKEVRVILFTDRPEYFSGFFKGLIIEYVLLTPEKIIAMRGDIDFLHRMKVALIEEAFLLSNENLLYADSDTFFIADPTPLMKQLTPGKSFMHKWEYTFEELRNWKLPTGKSFRDFLSLIESKTFLLSDGSEMNITPHHSSWNAGVMLFHASHARFIPDVYSLTEQFYPPSKNHACEQYAFSIMLQENTEIQDCEPVIYHYWYRVKKQIIDQFLETNVNDQWARLLLKDKLDQIKAWTTMLPDYFDKHEWMIKDHAIQAFNENNFKDGYRWALKAILQNPFGSVSFMRDTFYHIKRQLTNQ